MIILTLLHPNQNNPVQNWTFNNESIIKIGRSTDNNVVLYSAVVSRHHLEIRRHGSGWEVVNVGANGTYIKGKSVNKTLAIDGMIVSLASSGPKIQIHIQTQETPVKKQLNQIQEPFSVASPPKDPASSQDTVNNET